MSSSSKIAKIRQQLDNVLSENLPLDSDGNYVSGQVFDGVKNLLYPETEDGAEAMPSIKISEPTDKHLGDFSAGGMSYYVADIGNYGIVPTHVLEAWRKPYGGKPSPIEKNPDAWMGRHTEPGSSKKGYLGFHGYFWDSSAFGLNPKSGIWLADGFLVVRRGDTHYFAPVQHDVWHVKNSKGRYFLYSAGSPHTGGHLGLFDTKTLQYNDGSALGQETARKFVEAFKMGFRLERKAFSWKPPVTQPAKKPTS